MESHHFPTLPLIVLRNPIHSKNKPRHILLSNPAMGPLKTLFVGLCLLLLSAGTAADDAAVMSKLLDNLKPKGWSLATPYCQWDGIECDSATTMRVTSINLASKSLSGSLPSNLNSLTQLTSLSLSSNSLSGALPSLANLSSLQSVFLDFNNFTSIPSGCFQGLTSLQILSMGNNVDLAPWVFPTELTQSSSLVAIAARNTNLYGSVPDIFASFPNLRDVRLSYNNLTGPLPKSFSGSSIQNLWINNQATGLSGTIEVLTNMTQLAQVWLFKNQFIGSIPDLSICTNLLDLQLRDNSLTGLVPATLMSLSSLQIVSLDNNQLQGPRPAFGSNVKATFAGTNSFCKTTAGPCGPQVTALLEIAGAMGYPVLLAQSWQGNNACKDWSFIVCDPFAKFVVTVNFDKQHFNGTISPAYASLTSLKTLILKNNNLTGPIPESLTTLSHLTLFDVSNNNLFGDIPKFPSGVLITTGNPLIGTTPSPPSGGNSPSGNNTTPLGGSSSQSSNSPSVSPGMIAGSSSLSREWIIGISVGISMIILVIVSIIYISRKRMLVSFTKDEKDELDVEALMRNYGSPKRYRSSNLRQMTNSFKDEIGKGGFGTVYKGKLTEDDDRLVAVKVLSNSEGSGEDFINEVSSIGRSSHINIVRLVGFCYERDRRALIYEYMPSGSLDKFLRKQGSSSVDSSFDYWKTLSKIAVGIARGLEYLHRGCNTRILHLDIKPENILLDNDLCPKISDFGLAKLCKTKESIVSHPGRRGTAGYMAPEVYSRNYGGVSHKSDVYSYGMLVLEMVGARRNLYSQVSESHTSEEFPHYIYKDLELLDSDENIYGATSEEEKEIARKMVLISLGCIQIIPSDRPSMHKVLEMLEGPLESLPVPPKPLWTSPARYVLEASVTTSEPSESVQGNQL